ncbi:hypothetical protein VNO80_13373 [Phaseolus coccineus]|uniref:Uncharacterized protein n=1 Tax=Phaseolus coccineus TaxID=3886 RepID=A0AAN9N627_PHACN
MAVLLVSLASGCQWYRKLIIEESKKLQQQRAHFALLNYQLPVPLAATCQGDQRRYRVQPDLCVEDGIGKTVVKASKNVVDGWTTFQSATVARSSSELYKCPTRRIIQETEKVLEKALSYSWERDDPLPYLGADRRSPHWVPGGAIGRSDVLGLLGERLIIEEAEWARCYGSF